VKLHKKDHMKKKKKLTLTLKNSLSPGFQNAFSKALSFQTFSKRGECVSHLKGHFLVSCPIFFKSLWLKP